jgi:hypothetical protein
MRTLYNCSKIALASILLLTLSNFAQASTGLAFSVDIGSYAETLDAERLVGHSYRMENKKTGLMTYIVGEYKDFIVAQRARIRLKESGFNQSEVVAYFNSRPISMEDAFVIMDNRNAYDEAAYTASPVVAAPAPAPKPTIKISELNNLLDSYSEEVSYKVSDEISYTVQIGAFSVQQDEASFEADEAVQEHASEDGKYRYTTGSYIDYNNATTKKEVLQGLGIRDAFVVAYKDGQRISVQEALHR